MYILDFSVSRINGMAPFVNLFIKRLLYNGRAVNRQTYRIGQTHCLTIKVTYSSLDPTDTDAKLG